MHRAVGRVWLACSTLLGAWPLSAPAQDFFLVNQADFEAPALTPSPVFARIIGTRCHGVLEASPDWERGRVRLRIQQVRCADVEPPWLDVTRTAEALLTCKKRLAQKCLSGVLEPGVFVRF